jgi:uncharacterized protein
VIIADTGFFIALFNASDNYHQQALSLLNKLDRPLITTSPVITETCYLLISRGGGIQSERNFLLDIAEGAFGIYNLETADFARMVQLIRQYETLPMDYADASLVVLAERLGHGQILTTDRRDFQIYRWKQTKIFENLLFD